MEPKYFSSFQNAKSNGICVPTVLDSAVLIILTPLKIAKKIQLLCHEICGVYSRAGTIQVQGFNTAFRVFNALTPATPWLFGLQ